MGDPIDSFRLALRTLRRSPGYTLTVLVVLGVGVGATTAIFSLARWTLFRPVPGVERPHELMSVVPRPSDDPAGFTPLSHPVFRQLHAGAGEAMAIAAYSGFEADLVVEEGGEPHRAEGQVVTPGFFEALGASPARGRTFTEEEGDAAVTHAVAIVGHDLWARTLGGGDWIGRTLSVNGTRFEVVGIAGPSFRGPMRTDEVELWVPSSALPVVLPRMPANILRMPVAPVWTGLVARPPSGSDPEAVSARLQAAAPALERQEVRLHVHDQFGMAPSLRARLTETLTTVVALLGMVLLLTIASLVNLLLARINERRRETLLRRILGASPLQAGRSLAAESAVLGVGGSAVALAVAVGLLETVEGATLSSWLPAPEGVPMDLSALAFAVGTTLAAMAMASLVASTGLRRLKGLELLRTGSGATVDRHRLRRTLVGVQVSLSLALVVGAALLVESLSALQGPATGFDPEGVVVFSLNPGVQGRSDTDADRIFRELVEDVARAAAVEAAAFSWLAPLGARRYSTRVALPGMDGEEDALTVEANMVSPDFFRVLGMEVVEGRSFDDREYEVATRPERGDVVLNRALAQELFPDGSAVGREIVIPGRQERAFEVIGVVEDARLTDLRSPPPPALYDPFGNGYRTTSATFVARVAGEDPATALARLRSLARDRHPDLPVLEASLMDRMIAGELAEERALTTLVTGFAVLALLLAGAGLFGLMSTLTRNRLKEFGIRSALGAGGVRIAALALGSSLRILVAGVTVGAPLAWLVGRLLRARLQAIGGFQPSALLTGIGILLLVSLLASLPWALRASHADPARTLQAE